MSASAIAAARLSKARRNDLAAAGEVALDSTEASRRGRQRLHTALLAHDSGAHALNPSAAFEPLLQGDGIVQPLSSAAARLFSSHVTFSLPSTDDSSIHDAVHKFTLAADRSAKLNDGLRKFALSKERKAVAARKVGVMQDQARNGQGALPHPKDRSLAGVLISNEGGFQSYPDLFDYADLLDQLPGAAARQTTTVVLNEWGRAEFDDENVKGRRHCQELHSMASAAIDELGCLSIVSKNAGAVGTSSLMRPLHKANAWLNVNRADDTNLMHVHNSCRWSGTYYVAAPPDSTEKLDGRLIFRAGCKRRADGQPSAASHSFMTVPPTPGSLWLFPGSIPHRVLGSTMVPGKYQKVEATERGMWAPRISVAINFLDALAGLSDNRVGAPPPSFPVGHG